MDTRIINEVVKTCDTQGIAVAVYEAELKRSATTDELKALMKAGAKKWGINDVKNTSSGIRKTYDNISDGTLGGNWLSNMTKNSFGPIGNGLSMVSDIFRGFSDMAKDVLISQKGKDSGEDVSEKLLDIVSDSGLNPLKILANVITEAKDIIFEQLKQESVLLSELNSRSGLTGKLSSSLRTDMIEASIEGARYGVTLSEIGELYINLVENTGKFSLINRQTIESMLPTATALNMKVSDMAGYISEFEKVGAGADVTIKTLDNTATKMLSLGLNATKVTKELRDNIGKLNEYGFKNGIQGLTEMVKKANEFRMDVNSIFNIADKVFNPEDAISFTANLQMIGGALGEFNDPLKMMYMATNNIEGIQDSLVGAAKSLATYNQEQGRFEVTGVNLRRAKEMADAMGISMGELNKISIAAAERTSATTAMMSNGLNLTDDNKEFLTNISRMKGGVMKIEIPEDLSKKLGGVQEIALDKMTDSQAKVLLENQKAFQAMDTKEIAMKQLTETQQMSKHLESIAKYYTVRGAGVLRGMGEEALGGTIKGGTNAMIRESKRLRTEGATQDDALKYGGKIINDPLSVISNGLKRLNPFGSSNEKEKTTTKQEVYMNHNIKLSSSTNLDVLRRGMFNSPEAQYQIMNIVNPNEYHTIST